MVTQLTTYGNRKILGFNCIIDLSALALADILVPAAKCRHTTSTIRVQDLSQVGLFKSAMHIQAVATYSHQFGTVI